MKNIFLAVFFLICSSVFSQTFREVRVYVPPIEGSGRAEDSNFFFRQITYQVISQHHALVRARRSSDFILSGVIMSFSEISSGESEDEDSGEYSDEYSEEYSSEYSNLQINASGMEYVFMLELLNSRTNEVIGRQSIMYNVIDETIIDFISIIVFNMLSVIPEREEENNWYDNWLFVDLSVLWAPRTYITEHQSIHWFNFGIGISAEYHFLDFLSVEMGVQFSQDWIVVSSRDGDEERDLILEVPIALKYVLKPSNYLIMSPYAGLLLNYPVMGRTNPAGFSAFAGFEICIKAGPGMITIDPRFAFDLSTSSIPNRIEYQRYMMQIGIGYKIGFFPKNN